MTLSILQIIMMFVVPYFIIRYHDNKLTRLIGTIGMAYLLGILVSLILFALQKMGIEFETNSDIGEIGSHLAISIAIPLLLFSSNLKETRKLSKTVLISFGSLITSVLLVTAITFYIYGRHLEYGAELSGMAIGLYTGGTPNLNAIANIFGLDSTLIGLANLSDMIIGGVFYMFLLIASKPILSRFLKPSSGTLYLKETSTIDNTETIDLKMFKASKGLLAAFFIAFGMAALGAGLGIVFWLLGGSIQGRMTDLLVPTMMVTVTILGIVASFNRKIREIKGTNVLGQYLILVFSFALASSLDLTRMTGSFGIIILLYGIITLGAFMLHVIFSKVLKLDVDCTIVTATAGIYGPAFIPAITQQIKNDSLTIPGLICGSIGYAIGTFLGVGIGLLFLI